MKRILFPTILTLATLLAASQTPLSFEVASIKPAAPITDGRIQIGMGGDAGRINFSNVSVRDMLTQAYNVKDYQITGPDWLRSVRFDVTATLPANTSRDKVPEMLQTLLADRFKVALHRETKELPVYALLVAKSGLKVKKAEDTEDGAGVGRIRMMPGHMEAIVPMTQFATFLSRFL